MTCKVSRKGLVLGFYEGEKCCEISLTKNAQNFQESSKKNFQQLLDISGLSQKKGKAQLFFDDSSEFNNIALTNLGKKGAAYNEQEEVHEGKENVRSAVAAAVKLLNDSGVREIHVDSCGDAQAAAEGAYLSTWYFDDFKCADLKKPPPQLHLYSSDAGDAEAWNIGKTVSEGQNLARTLMESPANKMTPTIFAKVAQDKLGGLPNVTVIPRDKAWAESKGMNAFLGVAQGSYEPPILLEVHYKGSSDAPFAFVGKGITFDSGGISIKPSDKMDLMRADMGGAACVLSSIYAAAKLKLPVHLIGVMALTENMPGGRATKPGDVHTSMSGKTIQIDNTDAEGRLVLSDALHYAQTFKPSAMIDLATLTGAMMVALGGSATGVFTNSANIWNQMHQAGTKTGDRVWRMPLFKLYTKQMTETTLADINNLGNAGRMGGSCTAAAFLKEFVTLDHWMHMDIAGVMTNENHVSYLSRGMTGRPVRTLVEFIANYKKP